MYTYSEIEKLLAPSFRTVFADDEDLYNQFKVQAQSLLKSFYNSIDELTESGLEEMKQPFVWIFEYVSRTQLTGISPEFAQIIKDNYKQALDILKLKALSPGEADSNNSVEKIGRIEGLYENDY
jgi:hypothetical protein